VKERTASGDVTADGVSGAGEGLAGCRMIGMERYATKPTGYRQAAMQQLFCLFVVGVPYYQSLLITGVGGMISFLLLAFLLTFVVAHSPAIYRIVTESVKSLPLSWTAPLLDHRDRWVNAPMYAVAPGPTLAPSFQRPPPLFS